MGFDFDHTLGIDNKLERVAFLRLLDEGCRQGGYCIGTLAEEIMRIDDLLAEQRSGAFTIEEAVNRFMGERGIADSQRFVEQYKRMAVDMVEEFVVAEPGARQMLDELRRRGIACAILTNGWAPLQQRKAQCVRFEGAVIVSSEIGVQKPEPGAFAALAQALGAAAEEIAYVGDTPATDVGGALRAGMHAVWFDAEGLAYPRELARPSSVIHRLTELPDVLEA